MVHRAPITSATRIVAVIAKAIASFVRWVLGVAWWWFSYIDTQITRLERIVGEQFERFTAPFDADVDRNAVFRPRRLEAIFAELAGERHVRDLFGRLPLLKPGCG